MIFEKLLKTLVCLLVCFCCKAQNFSNKGTDFWVGYGYHQGMNNNLSTQNAQDMVLYFTSDVAASVKVEIPAVGYVKTYQVSPNSVFETDPIPKSGAQDARLLAEGLYKRGIHITSDNPIVAYTHIYSSNVSGATLLFPTSTLGQEYFSLNFTQKSNADNSNSWAYVIATEDNTAVEIVPSANTLSHPVGQPFVVTLNKGEIYNVMGTTSGTSGVDLTGTRIRSISAGIAGCKKIAVFSGAGRLTINCDNGVSSSDNVIQQVFPKNAWGKKYLTVPTSQLPNNYYRIAVSDPSTVVTIDGVAATNLVNGFYYQILANTPKSIVSDKPIMVAQYITSGDEATCGNSSNGLGDVEMMYLSPVEQTIDKITLNSTDRFKITSHYINVVIKSSAVKSFTIDGAVPPPSSFVAHPKDPAYSYAVLNVQKGQHTLRADSGFNAIAYGYGIAESYGYNAGTNIRDLYQFITLRNQYATVNFPSTCKDTRFFFSITLPFKASALTWDFSAAPTITPNQTVTQTNPVADSTYDRDGKTLYVYSLPSLYSFSSTGRYPVKIFASNQSADGCNGQEEITYNIDVSSPPVTNFTFTGNGCVKDSVYFTDASTSTGAPIEKWRWNFGDGTIDSVANPRKAFFKEGDYEIRETAINTIGCATEAMKQWTVTPKPLVGFTFTTPSCQGTPITFTSQSTINSGTIAKWNWNFGDGSVQSLADGNAFTKAYQASGNYNVSLAVETANGCKSDTAKQVVAVAPLPIANFILPKVCVNDPFALFTDSSYIPGSPPTSFTYKWTFGDANSTAANPNTSTVKNPQHKYSAAGSYNVFLSVSSNNGCSTSATKVLTVNGGSPVTDFSILNGSTICSNTEIVLKNNSSVDIGAINRVQLIWDSQANPALIQTDDTPYIGKTYSHTFPPEQAAKTYQVKMIAFSGTNCFAEKVISVAVNPSPIAQFSPIESICLSANARTITEARETSGLTGTFSFSGNGVTSAGLFDPEVAGPGTATLKYIYTSAAGCKDSASQTVEVIQNPVVKLGSPLYVLEGGSVVLSPSITGNAVKYAWSPATYLNNTTLRNPESTPLDSITYRLTASAQGGCEGKGQVTVLILKDLAVPNAFSPNGDGINDTWNIPSLASYAGCTVEVFNRFGNIVFRSFGYSKPWSGTYNGSSVPAGVYYYIIDPKNGKKRYTGYVTLLK